MSLSQQENLCEVCEEPNGWALMDPKYQFCCHLCIEDGLAAKCEFTGEYRVKADCVCGKTGAINNDCGYYCGGSPSCVP